MKEIEDSGEIEKQSCCWDRWIEEIIYNSKGTN
jgi:hypothetical protein